MASSSASDERRRAVPDYRLPEHRRIARVLRLLKSDLLTSADCFFGGGTAIVMKHGEYRVSLDVEFLCSSREGYRTLRQAVTAKGCEGIFERPVKQIRDFRCDQYGLRTAIEFDGQPIKLEIVREGRLDVTGAYDPALGYPLLSLEDQFAEKLLANSDRGKDSSAGYRDALDLGMLILAMGTVSLMRLRPRQKPPTGPTSGATRGGSSITCRSGPETSRRPPRRYGWTWSLREAP